MERLPLGIIVLLLAAGLLLLMFKGWRGVKRRSSSLQPWPLPEALKAPGAFPEEPRLVVPLMHLATSRLGKPLERVWVGQLAHRNRGRMLVFTSGTAVGENKDKDKKISGIVLELSDQRLHIPAAAIHGVGRGTWTVDRGTVPGRLVVVSWELPPAADSPIVVDSYFEVRGSGKKRAEVISVLQEIAVKETAGSGV